MENSQHDLPVRFWHRKDQPDDYSRSFFSLKSSAFRKIYNKHVNPFLRGKGFKASGFKAMKEDEQFHYMVFWGTGKWGGTGCHAILIHPKGLPTRWVFEWNESTVKEPHQYVFRKSNTLPNGNEWIDIGTNENEAQETCEYLVQGLENELDDFIDVFSSYPQPFLHINAENFESEYPTLYEKFGLNFSFQSKFDAATWLAIVHTANGSECNELIEIAKNEFISNAARNGYQFDESHSKIRHLNGLRDGKLW